MKPEVEVRVSASMDSLLLISREAGGAEQAIQALARLGTKARRSALGIQVSSDVASALDQSGTLSLIWTDDARRFADNRAAQAQMDDARLQIERLKSSDTATATKAVADSKILAELDDHQVMNLALMTLRNSPGLCVFDEQGTGKTISALAAFDLLVSRDEIDLMVVVAPKSMVGEWPVEIANLFGDLYRVAIVGGSDFDKRGALRSNADVFVMNFESAVKFEPDVRALLRAKGGRAILAVDESFFVKSADAKRTRAIRRLREWSRRAFVLCGTPAPNAPHDVIEQFNIVDFGRTFGGVAIPEDRTAALGVIQSAIEDRGLYVRHTKSSVLPNLPTKSFVRVSVKLEPLQQIAYDNALRDLIVDVRLVNEREFQRRLPNFLARRLALLQICSNPIGVVPGYTEAPAKLLALDQLLDDLIDRRSEKVVVWSFFRASVDAIVQRFARYGPVRFDGSVSGIAERRDAVQRFQSDDRVRLFVGNPAAAGAGLTLHRARFAVYESLSNQAAHYLQSIDRIHRRGQERPVEYLVLLADDTIEGTEYERLERKEESGYELLGDDRTRAWSRDALIQDLTRRS